MRARRQLSGSDLKQDAAAVTGTNVTAAMEGGVLKLAASDTGSASWNVGKSYDITEWQNLFFDLSSTGANWGLKIDWRGYANGSTELTSGVSKLQGDWGPSFPANADGSETALESTGIYAGDYDDSVGFFGSPNWVFQWKGSPENGTLYVDKVTIDFWGAGTLDLSALYMSDEKISEPSTDPSTDPSGYRHTGYSG